MAQTACGAAGGVKQRATVRELLAVAAELTAEVISTLAFTCGRESEREPVRRVECVVGQPFVTQSPDPRAATATAGS